MVPCQRGKQVRRSADAAALCMPGSVLRVRWCRGWPERVWCNVIRSIHPAVVQTYVLILPEERPRGLFGVSLDLHPPSAEAPAPEPLLWRLDKSQVAVSRAGAPAKRSDGRAGGSGTVVWRVDTPLEQGNGIACLAEHAADAFAAGGGFVFVAAPASAAVPQPSAFAVSAAVVAAGGGTADAPPRAAEWLAPADAGHPCDAAVSGAFFVSAWSRAIVHVLRITYARDGAVSLLPHASCDYGGVVPGAPGVLFRGIPLSVTLGEDSGGRDVLSVHGGDFMWRVPLRHGHAGETVEASDTVPLFGAARMRAQVGRMGGWYTRGDNHGALWHGRRSWGCGRMSPGRCWLRAGMRARRGWSCLGSTAPPCRYEHHACAVGARVCDLVFLWGARPVHARAVARR